MDFIKDKKIIVLIITLLLFTCFYFISVNKISYAFENNNNSRKSYDSLVDTIKKCSQKYAINNSDLFKEENVIYIKVQDLIDANLLVPNDKENVVSPLDKQTILNSNVIKIKKENDTFNVEIDL